MSETDVSNMSKRKYAYLNLTLKNIKGEKWKDLPELDGYYIISNFGRVKRLPYEMQYRNGAIYLKPEKIIKPGIVKQRNNYKRDYKYFLVNRVKLNGKRYNLSIARLVYHCFVKPFDLENRSIVIFYKDGDSFNIRPSNLLPATLEDKQNRIVLNKRARSHFLFLSKKMRRENRKKIVKTKSKQVTQYTIAGKKLKTFSSMAEAQRATGIFASSIVIVTTGKGITAGGYVWQWGNARKIENARLKRIALKKKKIIAKRRLQNAS